MKRCITYSGFLCLISIVLLATGISGCYYDKEQLLYPDFGTCDTAAVKYSTTVTPIVSASCYGCHAGTFPSGGISLDSYAGLRAQALNGKLYGVITHSSGFQPMPQNAQMLSACNIGAIKTWIDAGAPNN